MFPAALAAGQLDIALHTPENVAAGDVIVRREAAIWAGSAFHGVERRRPLPVALFDRACWWRERCVDLLKTAGIDFEVVSTCESVAGIRAAISAGLAVGVLPQTAFTDRVRPLRDVHLPQLEDTALVLTRSATAPLHLAQDLDAIITRTVRAIGRGPESSAS